MIDSQAALRFRRLGILTICAVYFVILVGSSVRASGAGMGCPDWPTCFGLWIPPTDVSQLPANYREIYIGYQDMTFNVVKTWTEYFNRLTGVTIGILIFLTAWSARIYLKTDKTVFYLAMTVFLLVGCQGWLGSAVVASNLKPLIITLHTLLAMVIVLLLIYAVARSQSQTLAQMDVTMMSPSVYLLIKIVMAMTLVQIAMGTQVRETVDFISHSSLDRQYWRESFPIVFYVHRSFSSIILFTNLWMGWKIYQTAANNSFLMRIVFSLMGLIVVAILAGVSLDRLAMPRVAQPIHLLMANLILGAQFFLFIFLDYVRKSA